MGFGLTVCGRLRWQMSQHIFIIVWISKSKVTIIRMKNRIFMIRGQNTVN